MESLNKLSSEQLAFLTLKLKRKKLSSQRTEFLPLIPVSRDVSVPLSFAQQRLWFLDQLVPNNPFYNLPSALRLEGRLDLVAMERVINEIVRRHEVLRTRIEVEEGEPVQVIDKWEPRRLEVEDLTTLREGEREEERRRIRREETRTGFDLRRSPLIRVKVLKLGPEEHVLLYTMHHIVSDWWSVGVLMREVRELYQAYSVGEESPLPELEIQYADYAVWQRGYLAGGVLESEVGYWKEQLNEAAILDLPTDHARPAVPSYRGGREKVELGKEVSEGLKRLSRGEGATLFMVLMASFKVILMRYSGEEDIVVGTPIANRTRREVEGLIGFFVNTLVLRTDMGGNPGFRELIKRERQVALGAYEHQEAPFETLVGEINPDRDLSRTPLFQVLMTLQNTRQEEFEISGLKMSDFGEEAGTVRFDLTLNLIEGEDGIRGDLEYSRDLFERETIRKMARHYEQVIEEVFRDAGQRIRNIELMSPKEKEQVIVEFNRTEREYEREQCLHELIELQVERGRRETAVFYQEESVTYGELNARANQLAFYLRRMGVGPEQVVGVMVGRGIEMVVGLLGVMKAGAAYLPLDADYPKQRLSYILQDARVTLLLTERRYANLLPKHNATVIYLDADWELIAREMDLNPASQVRPQNLVYVIYTSGSTGNPKGAMLTHESIVNCLSWMQETYRLDATDRFLMKTSLNFDPSVWELFWPLLVGGAVVIAEPQRHSDAAYLTELIEERDVTSAYFVPSMLRAFLNELGVERRQSLRRVVCGGESLTIETVNHFFNQLDAEFHHSYGPTETAIAATEWTCQRESSHLIAPIGKPLGNIQVYLLDAIMEPAPLGVPGELYIGGICVGRGYLNRAEMTAEKFVPDPYSKEPGSRLYRTGDLVKWRPDGELEFVGRIDHQVKLRGYRIELGEIEAALSGQAGIGQCAVIVREDEPGDKRLVAYVVGGKGSEEDTKGLRKYLKERLPDYMVPSAIVALENLPLTPSGKLDRKALPRPWQDQRESEAAYASPQTPVEEILLGIFEEVLKLDRVGIYDSFFEIGGHSLLATQVVSRVRNALAVEIGVRSLFEEATVKGLARRIEETMNAGEQREAPPLVRISTKGQGGARLPLSFAQQRLWFIDQLEPGNAIYNIPGGVRLEGKLELDVLESVINEIVRRHEVLRTRIEVDNGEPIQVIDEWEWRRLEVEDLTGFPQGEKEELARRIARDEARTGFDLGRGPLLRVKVLKLGQEQHTLLYTLHHIVSDGWSMGILFREVGTLYLAYRSGDESPLDELPIQYADFAVWQRGWLQGEVLEEELKYWRKQLAGIDTLELPTDHPRPAVQSYRGAGKQFVLEGELAEKLRELSHREGVTLFMTLLGGFGVLMSRYSRQTAVVVGTDIANRNRAEIEGLIGFFVNQLVLKVEVRATERVHELLKCVKEVCLGAYAHQELPFEKLVEEFESERDPGRSPLFQVKLILQNMPRERLELGGLQIRTPEGRGMASDVGTAKFDLTVMITDVGQDLVGAVEYGADLFEGETIERLMSHYTNVLREIVEIGERAIYELSLLSDQEKEQIAKEWNETARPYPQGRCLHELFAEQVKWGPGRIALVAEERQVSYGELNQRANQLAAYLQGLGVGPEMMVGLYLERSMEMVVAVLGVLKAGGGYLPLDPEYPLERVALMLEDAGVEVVLTERELAERLPVYWGHTVSLDEEWERISEESDREPESAVRAENPAYIMYTSGSSGRPKGVAVPHRAVLRLLLNTDYVRLDQNSCLLQLAPQTFDAATFEMWGALLHGGRLVISEVRVPSAAELGRMISKYDVDTMWLTASLYNMVVDEGVKELRGLKQLLIGGEALSMRHVRVGIEKLEGTKLINGYGPTEGTTFTCCHEIGAEDVTGRRGSVPIGRPIANTKVYVMDEWMGLAPVGVIGELFVGGDGLARCYDNRTELTAERFVPHPYSETGGERLYRTGDLVRHLSGGKIEFVGRADDQVKVRGYRIELGEIEAVLDEHRSVRRSVVVVREDERDGKRLLGYVVGDGGVTAADLKRHLRERVPKYMVPEAIRVLAEMPVTANGKIDRKRLLLMDDMGVQLERENAGARTPVEEILAGIFGEVLKLDRVGISDNFFEIGGHSLLATQVISRVRDIFGIEIRVRSIFEEPTAEDLARRIEEAMRVEEKQAAPPLVKVSRDQKLPLSFAQQRLWFLDQLVPNNPFYNISGAVRLYGSLDLEALKSVINEIVRRHEVLRTRIEVEAGEPVQVIDGWKPQKLEVRDLAGLSRREREDEIRRTVAEDAGTGFDLSRGSLIRVKVLALEEEEYVLLFTMHHIVSDAWSMGILIKEVGALFEAYSAGEQSPLPELEIQYADFAKWQREYLSGEVLESEARYWREQLQDASVTDLPTDFARPAESSYRGKSERVEIGNDLGEGLKRLSQREGATLFIVLMAAFKVLLMKYSGDEDVSVGTVIANRTRREIEELIGFFANTLVMRTDLAGNPSFRELIKREREVALGAYGHQELPFEALVEEINPNRDLSRNPLFQVMMELQNTRREELGLSGLKMSAIGEETGTAKFDLTLTVTEGRGGISGDLEYSQDLYERETIRRMARHYEQMLKEVVRDSEQRIREIELMGGIEREQILLLWNETAFEYPKYRSIHELFEEQVERTPEAMAVNFQDQGLTYRELNARANRLARSLVERGVGPEVLVAVLAEREVDFLITMLAVFKAGGAYLPLDPHNPAQRIGQTLGLSRAAFLITVSRFGTLAAEAVAGLTTDNQPTVFFFEEFFKDAFQTENLGRHFLPDQLAYVIFTSGSTGVPKGAMVKQRGMINHLYAKVRDLPLDDKDVVAQSASQCFDISVWQFLAALLVGGQVQIFEDEITHDPASLLDHTELRKVTILEIVPSMMRMMLTEADHRQVKPNLSMLRWLIPTGEALPPELSRQWYRLYPEIPLLNAYGPTECSDDVTHGPIKEPLSETAVRSPIGRPIANTQIYVLNAGLEPQPVGVAGELYIGGDGVGRGYLNDARKTAEFYMPAPFPMEAGARVYRSGDLARYLPDSNLEYLGRVDHQVKIRGFRIELEEIEAALREHGSVEQAVIEVREDKPGEKQLVAYVVKSDLQESGYEEELDSGQRTIAGWQNVFDEVYANQELPTEKTLINPRVWISSYTNKTFPEEEILECIEDTVARIMALQPKRVLEIGCGTGLILSRVAPHCEVYYGTDFSGKALSQLRSQLGRLGLEGKVKLIEQAGDNLSGMPVEFFDLVVINEVVQYFPSIQYLLRILEQMPELVAPESSIYLGDLRNLELLELFRASVEVSRASDSISLKQLRQRISKKMRREKELLIAPSFFEGLKQKCPWIEEIEIQLKGGHQANELVKYRYDAIVHVGWAWRERIGRRQLDWQSNGWSLNDLRRHLAENAETLEIQGIPNSRICEEAKIMELLREAPGEDRLEQLRQKLQGEATSREVSPQQLWDLGREMGCRAQLSWPSSGPLGAYRAIFQRHVERRKVEKRGRSQAMMELSRDWRIWNRYANSPLQEAVGTEQVTQWREFLSERLPAYMVPAVFVEMERLPLTPNGKLDRRALPAPDRAGMELEQVYVPPRMPVEEIVVGIFEEVLRLDRVGVHDNFFEIGGHSLLATQVISRLRNTFEAEINVRSLFEAVTAARLAEVLIAQEPKPGQTEKIALILKKLSNMTDEDADAELAALEQ